MQNRRLIRALFLIVGASISGCAATPAPPPPSVGIASPQNQGYSLLYKLMSDESRVGEVFILKSAAPPITDLIKEIAKSSADAKSQLDAFAKSDPSLNYTVPGLPSIEQQSRDLQTSAETRGLLFSGGEDFERRLIFTQAEAMNYAQQLATALSDHESDPARKSFLKELATHAGQFHDRLMSMFTVKP
jgi:hypothetical protein